MDGDSTTHQRTTASSLAAGAVAALSREEHQKRIAVAMEMRASYRRAFQRPFAARLRDAAGGEAAIGQVTDAAESSNGDLAMSMSGSMLASMSMSAVFASPMVGGGVSGTFSPHRAASFTGFHHLANTTSDRGEGDDVGGGDSPTASRHRQWRGVLQQQTLHSIRELVESYAAMDYAMQQAVVTDMHAGQGERSSAAVEQHRVDARMADIVEDLLAQSSRAAVGGDGVDGDDEQHPLQRVSRAMASSMELKLSPRSLEIMRTVRGTSIASRDALLLREMRSAELHQAEKEDADRRVARARREREYRLHVQRETKRAREIQRAINDFEATEAQARAGLCAANFVDGALALQRQCVEVAEHRHRSVLLVQEHHEAVMGLWYGLDDGDDDDVPAAGSSHAGVTYPGLLHLHLAAVVASVSRTLDDVKRDEAVTRSNIIMEERARRRAIVVERAAGPSVDEVKLRRVQDGIDRAADERRAVRRIELEKAGAEGRLITIVERQRALAEQQRFAIAERRRNAAARRSFQQQEAVVRGSIEEAALDTTKRPVESDYVPGLVELESAVRSTLAAGFLLQSHLWFGDAMFNAHRGHVAASAFAEFAADEDAAARAANELHLDEIAARQESELDRRRHAHDRADHSQAVDARYASAEAVAVAAARTRDAEFACRNSNHRVVDQQQERNSRRVSISADAVPMVSTALGCALTHSSADDTRLVAAAEAMKQARLALRSVAAEHHRPEFYTASDTQ